MTWPALPALPSSKLASSSPQPPPVFVDADGVFFIQIGSPNHYYGFGGWTSVNGHYAESLMGQKLGAPDGEGQYDAGSATWTRTFAGGHGNGGSTATFNVSSNTGTIMWAGKMP